MPILIVGFLMGAAERGAQNEPVNGLYLLLSVTSTLAIGALLA